LTGGVPIKCWFLIASLISYTLNKKIPLSKWLLAL
jgi:hypothetical protein